jgi:hypothetical protein
MSSDEIDPSEEPSDNLDDDLFDFPSMDTPGPTPGPASSENPSFEVEGNVDDLSAPLPTGDPLDSDHSSIDMSMDAEDEDLFGFPPVEGSASPFDPGPAQSVPEPTEEPVAEEPLLESEIDLLATQPAESSVAEGSLPDPYLHQGLAEQFNASHEPGLASPRFNLANTPKALWVLTGAAILFMGGILLIAWNLTSTLQQQIEASNNLAAVGRALPQHQVTPPANSSITFDSSELLEPQVTKTTTSLNLVNPTKSGQLDQPHESILIVAESAIGEGRFSEARKMLFMLLAEIDRVPNVNREIAEEQATFLIAQSHKSEAELLRGSNE